MTAVHITWSLSYRCKRAGVVHLRLQLQSDSFKLNLNSCNFELHIYKLPELPNSANIGMFLYTTRISQQLLLDRTLHHGMNDRLVFILNTNDKSVNCYYKISAWLPAQHGRANFLLKLPYVGLCPVNRTPKMTGWVMIINEKGRREDRNRKRER